MGKKQDVILVITDLDDTIWDWLTMWYYSFAPYYESIKEKCNIDAAILKNDFKKLHQKYGTTEVSYAYKELKSLSKLCEDLITLEKNEQTSILHQYYRDKKNNLKLFDSVADTLKHLKSCGVKLVGFTESGDFYTKYRIHELNLDGVFDCIYSPRGHHLPKSVKRIYPEGYWEPKVTEFRYLPRDFKKPNPEILLSIINDFKVGREETVYIGDKLDRDIYMANTINVTSVHASYGNDIDNEAYELLKEVTHWTNAEVARERDFKEKSKDFIIKSDFTINEFREILDLFNFKSYHSHENISSDKVNLIEIWKKIVGVQEHFNDLEIRIRNYALTLFTFIFTALAFCIKEDINFQLGYRIYQVAPFVSLVGILVLLGFFMMDASWYHRLLNGAVNQGLSVENSLSRYYPEIQLTKKIKEKSPIFRVHSIGKIRIFYLIMLAPLVFSLVFLVFSRKNNYYDFYHKKITSDMIKVEKTLDISNAPFKPGLIIVRDTEKSITEVLTVDKISKELDTLKASHGDNYDFYYFEMDFGKEDMKKYLEEQGISFPKSAAP